MAPKPPTVEDLLSANSKYAQSYTRSHSVEEVTRGDVNFPSVIIGVSLVAICMLSDMEMSEVPELEAGSSYYAVSCCDPRIIPEEFGIFTRESYVVVRNAGGRAEPAVRDIVVLSTMTNITDVVVVHHVDCGMTHLTNAAIREGLKKEGLGDDRVDSFEFGEIKDLRQSVKDDLEFLKSSPYIRKTIKFHGYVFDLLETGRLVEV